MLFPGCKAWKLHPPSTMPANSLSASLSYHHPLFVSAFPCAGVILLFGRLDLRSSPAHARQCSSKLGTAHASGRSSGSPQSALPSRTLPFSSPLQVVEPGDGCSVASYKQAIPRGITAAGTAPDSHRIPLRRGGCSRLIALIACKGTNYIILIGTKDVNNCSFLAFVASNE